MAISPNNHPLLTGLVLLLTAAAAVAAAPSQPPKKTPDSLHDKADLTADSADVDYKAGTAVYKKIVITQGDLKVEADQARTSGLSAKDSQWTFEGNVRIQSEQHGNLHSDHAVIEIKDDRIARAIVDGTPAEFEQKGADSGEIAHGHAGEIDYDVTGGTVRFSKDAWLSYGSNTISNEVLVYNIREQKLQAAAPAGTDSRVHFTITPNGKIEPEKKP